MTKAQAQMLLAQPDLEAGMSPDAVSNLRKGLDPDGKPLTDSKAGSYVGYYIVGGAALLILATVFKKGKR